VLSAGQGNDLSRTVEVSKSDQSKIDAAVTQILPILETVDPRLIFATLADIGIKVAQKDEVKT
jgi:hypothetical protein